MPILWVGHAKDLINSVQTDFLNIVFNFSFNFILPDYVKAMAKRIDTIANINGEKDLWKLAPRITDVWIVVNKGQERHLEMVIMDAKVYSYVITFLPFVLHSINDSF